MELKPCPFAVGSRSFTILGTNRMANLQKLFVSNVVVGQIG